MSKTKANSINSGVSESAAPGEVRPLLSTGETALVFPPPQDESRQVTQSTLSHHAPPPVTRPPSAESDSASTITATQSNLFIIGRTSQSNSIAAIECSNPSVFYQLAELAYSRRDIETLAHIAAQLLKFPDEQSQRAGRYYSALVAKRRGDEGRAIELLRKLDSPCAIQTRGAIEFDAGRYEQALPLFIRAAEAARGIDVATTLNALFQVSAIRSIEGDHRQALDDLLSLWPIVRSVKASHPHLFFNWHNDVAFELLAVGRIEDAKKSLSVALTSPISAGYHEYSETRADIERCERKRIIVTVRSIRKPVLIFRFCFIAKRVILSTVKPRVRTLTRPISERVLISSPTHAPPFNWKPAA